MLSAGSLFYQSKLYNIVALLFIKAKYIAICIVKKKAL